MAAISRTNHATYRHLPSTSIASCPSREWCQEVGLGNILYLGSKEWDEAGVAVVLVSQTNELKAIDGMAHPLSSKYSYSYRDDIGLRINKIKE